MQPGWKSCKWRQAICLRQVLLVRTEHHIKIFRRFLEFLKIFSFVSFFRKFFKIGFAETIRLVRRSPKSELSSRFFGCLIFFSKIFHLWLDIYSVRYLFRVTVNNFDFKSKSKSNPNRNRSRNRNRNRSKSKLKLKLKSKSKIEKRNRNRIRNQKLQSTSKMKPSVFEHFAAIIDKVALRNKLTSRSD